ncbi:MAG TPA: hypothetical protein VFS40_14710 [Gemmatimonadales bacterium]|nr:hypothetical protein [Gemmatimonadales bacterium]
MTTASPAVAFPGRARAAAALQRAGALAAAHPVALAVALGVLVRASHVLAADFPLNDGGMFHAMVRDLQANGFALPATTSYNGLGLPYAYPPLGFYLAAALDVLTPVPLDDLLRWIPLVTTALTLVAFAGLAARLLPTRPLRVAAVAAFALVPRSFVWLLMGGGLTRAPGVLFALLALGAVHDWCVRGRWRAALLAALCAGLTVLSHIGTAPWLAVSIVLFFLWFGRSRRALAGMAVVAGGATLVAAPWALAVVRVHGWAPFRAAAAAGNAVWSSGATAWQVAVALARFGVTMTGESFFPLVGVLAVLGGVLLLPRRQLLLPVWWIASLVVDPRQGATFASVPVALLAAVGACEGIWPLLRRAAGEAAAPGLERWFPAAVAAAALLYATAGALVSDPRYAGEASLLVALDASDRAAMRRMATLTPAASRFVVVSGRGWFYDPYSEWFPVATGRPSVATVQGTEWLPAGAFRRQQKLAQQLQRCGGGTAACLDRWAAAWRISFTHVYVPRGVLSTCCAPLVGSLRADPRWRVVYDGPGAIAFARVPAPPAAR